MICYWKAVGQKFNILSDLPSNSWCAPYLGNSLQGLETVQFQRDKIYVLYFYGQIKFL